MQASAPSPTLLHTCLMCNAGCLAQTAAATAQTCGAKRGLLGQSDRASESVSKTVDQPDMGPGGLASCARAHCATSPRSPAAASAAPCSLARHPQATFDHGLGSMAASAARCAACLSGPGALAALPAGLRSHKSITVAGRGASRRPLLLSLALASAAAASPPHRRCCRSATDIRTCHPSLQASSYAAQFVLPALGPATQPHNHHAAPHTAPLCGARSAAPQKEAPAPVAQQRPTSSSVCCASPAMATACFARWPKAHTSQHRRTQQPPRPAAAAAPRSCWQRSRRRRRPPSCAPPSAGSC